ncbi:MAG: hypothetical protein O3C10_10180 [Chloroflexi bacterium]|nr:hypothetical protein [Chloroflexota bacterium]
MKWMMVAATAAVAVVAAACSSDSPAAEPPPATAIPPTVIPATPTAEPQPVSGTGLLNGNPDYNFGVALSNAYWYSRYTLGSLSMMSGAGVAFEPPMEAVMGMVQAVDQGPAEGEHVVMPGNAALLRAVYAGGDPQFQNAFNGEAMDLTNYRWLEDGIDPTLTPAAQAQTIIKQTEWAKFFNSPGWGGTPSSDFGAMHRFKGMVMFAEAAQIATFALQNLRNEDGLFVAEALFNNGVVTVSDASVHPADQYQMLQALSDLRILLSEPDLYNGLYRNPDLLAIVSEAVDDLFARVAEMEPGDLMEMGIAAQALAWYAASTDDPQLQSRALDMLGQTGDALVAAAPTDVIGRARAARGLWEASRVLGDDRFSEAAAGHVTALLDAYNPEMGYFESALDLHDWEVGDILGALNSTVVNGSARVDPTTVQGVYANFFEATVNIGGLLQARIPKEMEASPFELARITNDIEFAYPTIPSVMAAGGANGTAAVHASRITFDMDAGQWRVTDRRFDTAAAMHTSNEMMWTFGSVSGFPSIDQVTALDFPIVSPVSGGS